MPKLWTVKDCAAAWGLSEGRACALLRAGRVPDARQRIIRGHVEWQVPEGTPKPEELPPGRPEGQPPKAERKK
jgi:hypothetical protein